MEIVTTEIRKLKKFENLKKSIEFLKNYKSNKEIEFIFYEFDEYYAEYYASYESSCISIQIKNVRKIKKMLSTFEHFRGKIPKNIKLMIYNEEIIICDGDILEVTKVNLSNKNIKELENYFEKNNKKIKKMKIRSWNRKYFFIE